MIHLTAYHIMIITLNNGIKHLQSAMTHLMVFIHHKFHRPSEQSLNIDRPSHLQIPNCSTSEGSMIHMTLIRLASFIYRDNTHCISSFSSIAAHLISRYFSQDSRDLRLSSAHSADETLMQITVKLLC